jgi:hypothetical protein
MARMFEPLPETNTAMFTALLKSGTKYQGTESAHDVQFREERGGWWCWSCSRHRGAARVAWTELPSDTDAFAFYILLAAPGSEPADSVECFVYL